MLAIVLIWQILQVENIAKLKQLNHFPFHSKDTLNIKLKRRHLVEIVIISDLQYLINAQYDHMHRFYYPLCTTYIHMATSIDYVIHYI
jgi:hypothetical protein